MTAVLFGWDDEAQRAVEFSVHNPTALIGLPKTPLNARNDRGYWEKKQDGAFGSIVELDLSGTGGLVDIQDASFAYLPNLRVVGLNPKTRSIGTSAFEGCKSLTTIDIPSGVTSIAKYAFSYCRDLKSINIPSEVTSIGECAFYGCTSLTSINIPSGVTAIGRGAFWSCISFKSINIPSEVASIERSAFCNCTSLTSINIPIGVASIDACAFCNCTRLRSINIPGGVTSIGWGAFSGCSLEVVLVDGPKSLSLESLPAARRFVADWIVDGSLAVVQGVAGVSGVVVSIGGKKLCAPIEDDWRFLERLDKSPLDE